MRVICNLFVLGVMTLLIGGGCAHTAPSRFYLLSSEAPESATAGTDEIQVGIMPVIIADYLDVRQMVRRQGVNELEVNDFHLWAEPLHAGIARVLCDDLNKIMGKSTAILFPWPDEDLAPDVVIKVRILRFEADAAGVVTLQAAWSLQHGNEQPTRHSSTFTGKTSDTTFAGAVAAMSRVLGQLAAQIAAQVGHR